VAEIRTRTRCADHWQTQDARRTDEDVKRIVTLPEEGRPARPSVALGPPEQAPGGLGPLGDRPGPRPA
jgi:hypothetical protein